MKHLGIVLIGICAFVLMQGIKIPMKWLIQKLVDKYGDMSEQKSVFKKRMGLLIYFTAFLVAILLYFRGYSWFGETHFKLCNALKTGVIATFVYAIYERFI